MNNFISWLVRSLHHTISIVIIEKMFWRLTHVHAKIDGIRYSTFFSLYRWRIDLYVNFIFEIVIISSFSGSICRGVLEDPIQAPTCEHTFCRVCIEEWLSRSSTCPIDRTIIEFEQLKSIPRILRNLLNRLDISCENEGCSAIVKLDLLARHSIDCEFSPKKYLQCSNGCQMNISKEDLPVCNRKESSFDWCVLFV